MKTLQATCFLALAAAPLCAQRTWTVDANNGPGTDFTRYDTAVAAAAEGDTIRVRAGRYSGATIGKALTVLGDGAPFIGASIISGIRAGRTLTIKGIQPQYLLVRDCPGRVHFDELVSAGRLLVIHANLVTMNRTAFGTLASITFRDSRGVLTDCSIRARATGVSVRVERSTLHLAGGTYQGADVFCGHPWSSPPSPALLLDGGAVVVTGDASTTLAAGNMRSCPGGNGWLPGPAIEVRNGSIVIDPDVRLQPTGTAPAVKGGAPRFTQVPAVFATAGAPGTGRLQATTVAPANALAALFVSATTDGTTTPFGTVWIDVQAAAQLDAWIMGPAGRRRIDLPLANVFPRGLPLVLQAAAVSGGQLALSPPAVISLH